MLEARNRTGGRIFTDKMGSNNVEMGPNFINGIGPGINDDEDTRYKGKNNPIYTIAQSNNITTVQAWADGDNTNDTFYSWKSSGAPLDFAKIGALETKISDWAEKKQDAAPLTQTLE